MREDRFTNDVAGAEYYERARGSHHDADDRPSRSDFGPEDAVSALGSDPIVRCTARGRHNPTPDGEPNAPGCWHCPVCGSRIARPYALDEYFYCTSNATCSWSHGTPSDPPF